MYVALKNLLKYYTFFSFKNYLLHYPFIYLKFLRSKSISKHHKSIWKSIQKCPGHFCSKSNQFFESTKLFGLWNEEEWRGGGRNDKNSFAHSWIKRHKAVFISHEINIIHLLEYKLSKMAEIIYESQKMTFLKFYNAELLKKVVR